MSKSRWMMVLGILPLTMALAACNAQGTTEEETAAATPELKAAEAPQKAATPDRMRGGHHQGKGPGSLLGAALRELDLSEAQRTAIQAELDALHEARPERGDRAEHRAALAAAVRRGKVDASLVPAAPAEGAARHARVVKAVKVLHDTLSAEQRRELVSKVREQREERGFGFGEGRRGGKHGGEMRGAKGEMGRLGRVLHGIELTEAQRAAVREALAKEAPKEADREAMKARHEAMKQAMDARLQSFAADTFDAEAFAAPPKDAPRAGFGHGPGAMVKTLAAVVPILDEAQRAELAQRIEQGPPEGRRGRR